MSVGLSQENLDKYHILAFQGPADPEMIAVRLAFWKNLFLTDVRTHRFMYRDWPSFNYTQSFKLALVILLSPKAIAKEIIIIV